MCFLLVFKKEKINHRAQLEMDLYQVFVFVYTSVLFIPVFPQTLGQDPFGGLRLDVRLEWQLEGQHLPSPEPKGKIQSCSVWASIQPFL